MLASYVIYSRYYLQYLYTIPYCLIINKKIQIYLLYILPFSRILINYPVINYQATCLTISPPSIYPLPQGHLGSLDID